MSCPISKINKTISNESNLDIRDYELSKSTLISIMNRYIKNTECRNKEDIKYVVTIGEKGSGKSTLAKILYGVNNEKCNIGMGNDTCTKEIHEPFKTQFRNLFLIDSIGITLNYENIAKLFLLLISKDYYPDLFVLPGERVNSLHELNNLTLLGIFDVLFVPFSPSAYHTAFKMGNEYKATDPLQMAYQNGFNEFLYVGFNSLISNFKLFDRTNSNANKINNNTQSKFIELFFKDGSFIDLNIHELVFTGDLTKDTINIFYKCLVYAVDCIPKSDFNNLTNTITIKNEDQYLVTREYHNSYYKTNTKKSNQTQCC